MSKRNRRPRPNAADEADHIDPSLFFFADDSSFKDSRSRARTRKTAQLCAEVERLVATTLDCDLDDPALDGVRVLGVHAEPGAARFQVTFAAPSGSDLSALVQCIERAAGVFRASLAAGLSRKRVPALSFLVVPDAAEEDAGW